MLEVRLLAVFNYTIIIIIIVIIGCFLLTPSATCPQNLQTDRTGNENLTVELVMCK